MKNAGWLFYKDYYRTRNGESYFASADFKNFLAHEQGKKIQGDPAAIQKKVQIFFDDKNKAILDTKADSGLAEIMTMKNSASADTFKDIVLKIGYPGMITGTGIPHETGLPGEFKIGFMFDYTTGIPYLPGSSVKGILRSAFPKRMLHEDKYHALVREQLLKFYFTDVLKKEESWFLEKLSHYFESIGIRQEDATTSNFFDLAERQIFHNEMPLKTENSNRWALDDSGAPIYTAKPPYNQDIFYDAFIIDSSAENKKVFDTDFITPHINRNDLNLSPFTNPVPLLLLKISPGVSFCFQWQLHNDLLESTEKSDLFVYLLTLLGVGAKTNVGYGQLSV